MSKLESFVAISLGFFLFLVLFIRVGYLFGQTISSNTILAAYLVYLGGAILVFSNNFFKQNGLRKWFYSLGFFLLFSLLMVVSMQAFKNTYDTSWDGQGYNQSAVIALADGWNPILDPDIDFKQRLPSQIFAEGYPSAIWEIQASIYRFTGNINSAKSINLAFGVIAACLAYILLRRLKFNRLVAGLISLLVVIQPVYLIQFLTFMQDGLGYQLVIIAVSSLVILILDKKAYWSLLGFLIADILLVSSKYNHLPIVLILSVVFLMVVANRFMNREYILTTWTKLAILFISLISLFFSITPYVRNMIFHGYFMYPTNIVELMGSVAYNNIPRNLEKDEKISLLMYGIFSRSQDRESGDPRSLKNIAELKAPFVFTMDEVTDSVALYNNRVGAAGPLFSGLMVLSIGVLILSTFKAKNKTQRYGVYSAYFILVITLLLSLVTPAPNLLRYVSQIQLLPLAIFIPLYMVFNSKWMKLSLYLLLVIMLVNISIYSYAVIQRGINDHKVIAAQFEEMRSSHKNYLIRAQEFYSSYILLSEQGISFNYTDNLSCNTTVKELYASSNTTHYCLSD